MEMPRTTLLASVALTADRTSKWLDCQSARVIQFDVDVAQAGAATGIIKVQGTDDPAAAYDNQIGGSTAAQIREVEVPENAVHGLGAGQAWAAGTVTFDGTAAVALSIKLEHPFKFMRVFLDHTGAGNGSSLAVVRGSKRS